MTVVEKLPDVHHDHDDKDHWKQRHATYIIKTDEVDKKWNKDQC